MKVILAGYNTDVEASEDEAKTPETISAAYARISRDPGPVNQLRESARKEVEKARRSNRRIVFEYGHGSVAEHAVFNLDIIGISRLAAEALQAFRLASFTEKSQRYIHIGDDWIIPSEYRLKERKTFSNLVGKLFESYEEIIKILSSRKLDQERIKEDARYVLPLATTCQMGVTMNARVLEHVFRRLAAHPLEECRELAKKIYMVVTPVAPSLFLFTEPADVDVFANAIPEPDVTGGMLSLLRFDDDGAVGSYLLCRAKGISFEESRKRWKNLSLENKRKLFRNALCKLGIHDTVPRCWELARFTFEMIVSATSFAQLKRHRMCTQLVSRYSPRLGATRPDSFSDSKADLIFKECVRSSEIFYNEFPFERSESEYCLTNAHRRKVIVDMNARELYHFSRLRLDKHAQWDIRQTALLMVEAAREKAPLTTMFMGGKSEVNLKS